ncbi:3-keto-5-aminohexanoate cleavage protein [Escherichia coli]
MSSNGPLIDRLAAYVREAGRQVASPDEARAILKLS